MSVTYQQPEVRVDPGPGSPNATVETHPAYAQIGASRVSGHAALYGSDFLHNGYMTIRIYRSEVRRDLSTDWYHAGREMIAVSLSEAQWATFVSSPNAGMGVPCTLEHVDCRSIPQIPEPPRRAEQFKGEISEVVAGSLTALSDLQQEIEGLKVSGKVRDALIARVDRARAALTSSVPFVEQCFGEHVENVLEHAKVEVSAYIMGAIMRAGLKAADGLPVVEVLALPERTERAE